MTKSLCAVVLAAGAGQRMGYLPKCLIEVDGQSLLQRLLQALQSLAPQATVVVTGHHAAAVDAAVHAALAQAQALTGLQTAHNPQPGATPADSLRIGLQCLRPEQAEATLIVLADLPLIKAEDLRQVLNAYQQRAPGQAVLWPHVRGQPGHPIVISRAVAEDLLKDEQLTLKRWCQLHPQAVAYWPTEDEHFVRDLDTPEDLQRLRHETGLAWTLPLPPALPVA